MKIRDYEWQKQTRVNDLHHTYMQSPTHQFFPKKLAFQYFQYSSQKVL